MDNSRMTAPVRTRAALWLQTNLQQLRPFRALGVLGIMLMGLSWGIPWFRALTQSTYALSTAYAFSVFGGMMLGAYLFVRLLNAMRLRAGLRRGVLLLVLLASILIGLKTLLFQSEDVSIFDLTERQLESFADAYALIPDEFIVTVAVLLVWRRGTILANEKIGPRLVQSAFGIGMAMFFMFIFFNTIITGEGLGNLPALFLFAGLMAMGAARVSVIGTLRGGRDSPFDRRWMTSLFVSVAGAVGVAAWLGSEIGGGKGLVALLPRYIMGAAIAIGFLLLTPIFVLLWWALYTFVSVIEQSSSLSSTLNDFIGRMQALAEGAFSVLGPVLGPLGPFLARFGILTKTLILWAIVLALVLAIVLAMVIQDRRRRKRLREEYERILARGLWNSLRDSLNAGLRGALDGLGALFDPKQRRRLLTAARIRRIYAQLMGLCRTLDSPRPDAYTPREFVPTLKDLFPALGDELALITDAYQQVRYGEIPEDREELLRVEQAWQRVQSEGAARQRG